MNQNLNWSCSKIEEIIAVLQLEHRADGYYVRLFSLPFFLKGSQACSYREPSSSSRTSIKFGGEEGWWEWISCLSCDWLPPFLIPLWNSWFSRWFFFFFFSRRGWRSSNLRKSETPQECRWLSDCWICLRPDLVKALATAMHPPPRVCMRFPALRITSRWSGASHLPRPAFPSPILSRCETLCWAAA